MTYLLDNLTEIHRQIIENCDDSQKNQLNQIYYSYVAIATTTDLTSTIIGRKSTFFGIKFAMFSIFLGSVGFLIYKFNPALINF